MTTELVLLMAVYAFILIGVFLGDEGPIASMIESGPKLAAKIERNITVGRAFKDGDAAIRWEEPPRGGE